MPDAQGLLQEWYLMLSVRLEAGELDLDDLDLLWLTTEELMKYRRIANGKQLDRGTGQDV